MKIIGMIPARGGSTRFNNKPLADICGKPMVYWVWKHSKEVSCFDEVYVATDSEEIKNVAEGFGAKVIMTSSNCETATERLYEVSKKIQADLYVMVNGDEPLSFILTGTPASVSVLSAINVAAFSPNPLKFTFIIIPPLNTELTVFHGVISLVLLAVKLRNRLKSCFLFLFKC